MHFRRKYEACESKVETLRDANAFLELKVRKKCFDIFQFHREGGRVEGREGGRDGGKEGGWREVGMVGMGGWREGGGMGGWREGERP